MCLWYKKYTYHKKQISFRSINHESYTVTSNKIAIRSPNENYKQILDEDGITTYPHILNIPFINYFDDKGIHSSINELRKYIGLLKND